MEKRAVVLVKSEDSDHFQSICISERWVLEKVKIILVEHGNKRSVDFEKVRIILTKYVNASGRSGENESISMS